MNNATPSKTLGELRDSQYTPVDIRNELRNNLIRDLRQEVAVSYTHLTLPTSDLV